MGNVPAKAGDFIGRWREVVSDPLNLLINRVSMAGAVEDSLVTLHNGIKVPVEGEGTYYSDFSKILVINRGVHEPLEEYCFQECLKRMSTKPVMLELGAYWGHYSMWLKRVRPEASVVLVEPEEGNMRSGQLNFERNGMSGTFLLASVGKGQFEVDRFLATQGLDRLDILHADIQGAEVEMLEGAQLALQLHAIGYVFISTHSPDLHNGVIERLTAYGYRIDANSSLEDTTACDGLVAAAHPDRPSVFKGQPMSREAIARSTPKELLAFVSQLASSMEAP